MPLVTLDAVSLAYGHVPLLERVALQVETGERICAIGRNGSGKSTLLRLLSGELPADAGTVWRAPETRVARLEQDVPLSSEHSVFDVVAGGLQHLGDLVAAYHHAAVEVAEHGTGAALDRLGRLQQELERRDAWSLEQRVELVLDRLALPADAVVDTLSGGWRRRVLLARALVAEPDVLLLDEPTNHLDIDAIRWLEDFLDGYPGAIVFVTHDRAFLQRLATRIVELDRGRLTSWPGDYATYLRRKEEWLAAEEVAQEKFDKKLAEEEAWLRQGIKARRTRNEGRVSALLAMREERAARRSRMGSARLQVEVAEASGKVVFEATRVSKAFGNTTVVRDVSVRVMRGDRIGLLGPNGAGKTTLIRLLLGEIAPDSGDVRHGANLQVAYYDQQREQLDPDRSVFDTLGEGNDTIVANGVSRHVQGYLRDFLFAAEQARSPVRSLSGGERNRLLLARLFTRPANVLVLDEPTNDLDVETLELLEAQVLEFPGTVLLVSHDRVFLDNVATSTLVFEGEGRVQEYVGGYEDWLRQRPPAIRPEGPDAMAARPPAEVPGRDRGATPGPAEDGSATVRTAARPRLGFNEQRELAALPSRIEQLEQEQQALTIRTGAQGFYKEGAASIATALARLAEVQAELAAAYARWDDLDSRNR